MSRRRARNLARRAHAVAPCPIISVGNLSTGGTGKTPTVQWLVRVLQRGGCQVGVAARGYGGTHSAAGALVSDGRTTFLTAREAGDEAVLHARTLPGTVVAIGKDRFRAVSLAIQAGAEVVVLDDGFQFWSLPRAFDIVLLDAKAPWGNGHLLPVGRLREEPTALSRASAILLTRADRATPDELLRSRSEIARWTAAPVFEAVHAPLDLRDETTGSIWPLSHLKDQSVAAFAGLADNAQFYRVVRELTGVPIAAPPREHGDHHAWTRDDFRWLTGASLVITTEKDAVKCDPAWFGSPLLSLRIGLRVRADEEALVTLGLDTLSL